MSGKVIQSPYVFAWELGWQAPPFSFVVYRQQSTNSPSVSGPSPVHGSREYLAFFVTQGILMCKKG